MYILNLFKNAGKIFHCIKIKIKYFAIYFIKLFLWQKKLFKTKLTDWYTIIFLIQFMLHQYFEYLHCILCLNPFLPDECFFLRNHYLHFNVWAHFINSPHTISKNIQKRKQFCYKCIVMTQNIFNIWNVVLCFNGIFADLKNLDRILLKILWHTRVFQIAYLLGILRYSINLSGATSWANFRKSFVFLNNNIHSNLMRN